MGVGAALVVAVGLGILAWTQRDLAVEQRDIADQQRIEAEARELAALSQVHLETDLDLATLLSIEAHKRVPNYLTQGSLLSVLQADPYTIRQFHLYHSFPDLEFNPDGDYIAATGIGNILFWDPLNYKQMYEPIIGHSALIHDIAINYEGSMLVSGSEDGTLKLWDLENDRELIATLLENDNLSSPMHVAFSPDDSILAAATKNGEVWVWDTETLEVVSKNTGPLMFDSALSFSSALFINNNNQIVLFTSERVEIWDYQSGERISLLAGESIDDIDFDPDIERLVGFDWDEPRIYVWDSETGKQVKNIKISSSKGDLSHTNIKFQPNGEFMFLINDDVILYLDWQNPEKIYTYKDVNKFNLMPENPYVTPVFEFNPDGRSFLYGGLDGIVYLESVFGADHENDPFYTFEGAGSGLSISTDGATLAATGLNEDDEPVINLWSFPDLNLKNAIELGQDDTQLKTLLNYQVQFLPDGKLLFSGIGGEIRIYDRNGLSKVYNQIHDISSVSFFGISHDGKYLAGKNKYDYSELQIWDIEQGELLGELVLSKENRLEDREFNCVAFSPDNKILAACADDQFITFWDLETFEIIGNPIVSLNGSFDSLEYSHDGRILSSSGGGAVSLWDVKTRFSMGVPMINSRTPITKILFNQDDSVIFTGNEDGEISLWDVQTQQPIGLPISDQNARALAADLPDFDTFYGLNGHSRSIVNMVLSADDRYLITMDDGGTLHIWDFDIESWYDKACLKAGRNLTPNEWELYFPHEGYRNTCPQFEDKSTQSTLDLSAYTARMRKIDNMIQVFVPQGEFEYGSRSWTEDNTPYRIIELDSFWIDQTEVTNSQYKFCVDSGSCTQPANNSSETRNGNYYGSGTYADYPVVFVTIDQAEEYCRWAGGRIPLETEWEKAARGTSGYDYPWGNSPPDSTLVNFHYLHNDTTKVGSYPAGASPYGALDMAGNVYEWTIDVDEGESETLYPGVLKGEAFVHPDVKTWMRMGAFDGYYASSIGFRCVTDE